MINPENEEIESFFEVSPRLSDVVDLTVTASEIPRAKRSSFAELANELSLPVFKPESEPVMDPPIIRSHTSSKASFGLFSSTTLKRGKKKSRNRSKSLASNPSLRPRKSSNPTIRFGQPGPVKVKSTTSAGSARSKHFRKRGKKSNFNKDKNVKVNNDKKKTFLNSVSTRLRRKKPSRKKSMPNIKQRKFSDFDNDVHTVSRPRTTENVMIDIDRESNDIIRKMSGSTKPPMSPLQNLKKKKSNGKVLKNRSLNDTFEIDDNEI